MAWCHPSIAPEDFFRRLGMTSPLAACLVGPHGNVLAANRHFVAMAGPLLSPSTEGLGSIEELLLAEDLFRLQAVEPNPGTPVSARLRDRRRVTLTETSMTVGGTACSLLIFARDPHVPPPARELNARRSQAPEPAPHSTGPSMSMRGLQEGIRRIPAMARRLLQIDEEQRLYQEAARVLCQDDIGLVEATFLNLEGQDLVVAFSTRSDLCGASFSARGDTRYATVFCSGGPSITPWEGGGFILPLRGRQDVIGLMEVMIAPQTRTLFAEDHRVSLDIYDALVTVANIVALLVENTRLYKRLKRRSQTDVLTGLYNREYLEEEVRREIARGERSGRPLSVLFVDVDNLKGLNDALGHLQVDGFLRELADILVSLTRRTDCVCRYGGDEFVILLAGTDLEAARAKGEEICAQVASHPFPVRGENCAPQRLTVSLGAAAYMPGTSPAQFLSAADGALYRAKALGKNRLAVEAA